MSQCRYTCPFHPCELRDFYSGKKNLLTSVLFWTGYTFSSYIKTYGGFQCTQLTNKQTNNPTSSVILKKTPLSYAILIDYEHTCKNYSELEILHHVM